MNKDLRVTQRSKETKFDDNAAQKVEEGREFELNTVLNASI